MKTMDVRGILFGETVSRIIYPFRKRFNVENRVLNVQVQSGITLNIKLNK